MLMRTSRSLLRRRALCTTASSSGSSSSSSDPTLTRWGSFGATAEQIGEMVERVSKDGEHQARLTGQLAEVGLKLHAMLTRPMQWFGDAEWRKGWMEQMAEPMERYSRINDRLLDGCEHAYQAVAEEFCSPEPDFEAFVQSGAVDPQLAAFLQTAATEHRPAGQALALDISRVNAKVLMLDSMSGTTDGFVATVVFRSRERLTMAPMPAGAAAADAGGSDAAAGDAPPDAPLSAASEAPDAATAATTASSASAAPAADTATATAAEASEGSTATAAAEAASGDATADEFQDSVQVWTFTAERPPVREYLTWLQTTMNDEGGVGGVGGDGDYVEKPVAWQLRDINFVIEPYEAPELPDDAGEMLRAIGLQLATLVAVVGVGGMAISNIMSNRQRAQSAPPLGLSGRRGDRDSPSRVGGGGGGGGGDKTAVWSQDLQPQDGRSGESGGGGSTM